MRVRNESRLQLLSLLLREKGHTIPGPQLANEMKITRQAVSALAEALREEGIDLLSIPQKGYRIVHSPHYDTFSPTWSEWLLKDCPWGHPILHFSETTSTQHVARQFAQEEHAEGLVVLADQQTAGKGSRGREWHSPNKGNIYLSLLMRPKLSPGELQLLSFAVGMAVAQTLRESCGIPAVLKWPNDVLVDGKKLCGILCESACEPSRIYYAVAGIGINVNAKPHTFPDSLRSNCTSMCEQLDSPVARTEFVSQLIPSIYRYCTLLQENRSLFLSRYKQLCSTLHQHVQIICEGQSVGGRAETVNELGALLVNIGGHLHTFSAADVLYLRHC